MMKLFKPSCRGILHSTRMVLQQRTVMSPALTQAITLSKLEGCADNPARGLVLGIYKDENDPYDFGVLTPTASLFNEHKTKHRLRELLQLSPVPKAGQYRIFFGAEEGKTATYSMVAVVGLGKQCLGYDPYECLDQQKEVIRRSVARACSAMCELEATRIDVDSCGNAESAAEGASLGIWAYQDLREKSKRLFTPITDLYTYKDEVCDIDGWRVGLLKANAQNLTRQLQEMPSNLLTPTTFAQTVVEVLCRSGVNVEVKVEGWAESQSMNNFLATGKASCETPIFLELSYYGTRPDVNPVVLVGQGLTYDCGGLCLKKFGELQHMRGDMTGAAVVVAACRAIATLRLPINIRGLIPLCENMIGCNAFRSGDIYKAMNGKSIKIEGTDHEDVLVLSDALLYAQNFCPKFIIDIGTTSGAMRNALDEAASGVFTNSEILWQKIKNASMHTGDRVWRMPLWDYYGRNVKATHSADLRNYGTGRGGRPCKAAAFLREFVPCGQWMHIDATNVMVTTGTNFEYLRKGMAGRPTRTIVELLASLVCKDTAPKIDGFTDE